MVSGWVEEMDITELVEVVSRLKFIERYRQTLIKYI